MVSDSLNNLIPAQEVGAMWLAAGQRSALCNPAVSLQKCWGIAALTLLPTALHANSGTILIEVHLYPGMLVYCLDVTV